jgi:hypothetical protein
MQFSPVFSNFLHLRSDYPLLEHLSYHDGVLHLSKLSGVMPFIGNIMSYFCKVSTVSTRHDVSLCGVRLTENMLDKNSRLADNGQSCS